MGKIYQVCIIGLKGERIMVDISESETEFNEMKIVTFKKLLMTKMPSLFGVVNVDDLRLVFSDKQLENEKSFSHYQIRDKSTILVITELVGGAIEQKIENALGRRIEL